MRIAFTEEHEQLRSELRSYFANLMTDEVREMWQEWDRIAHDVTYLDLHQPWFASHR